MADGADPKQTATSSTAPDSNQGSALCTQCGLCCTGALHNAAVLDAGEIPAARALGLPVLDREEPGFALPCPRLDGTICTIYGSRPRVCSRYKCQLLQDLEAGALELDAALEKVRIAKALRREVEKAMPAGMTLPQARDFANTALKTRASGADHKGLQLTLRSTALNLYLDKHFRNSPDGRAFDVMRLGEEIDEPARHENGKAPPFTQAVSRPSAKLGEISIVRLGRSIRHPGKSLADSPQVGRGPRSPWPSRCVAGSSSSQRTANSAAKARASLTSARVPSVAFVSSTNCA